VSAPNWRASALRYQRENAELRAKLAAAEADAGRYRWLKARRFAADFEYGDAKQCVVVIAWPESVGVSVNFDADIDAATRKEPQP
jgi:hypothetical protein